MKRARLRPQAEADLVEAARYYVKQGGRALGERMFDAALTALEPVQRMPGIGSPRIGELCEIPGLRGWGITGFPMRWFYFEMKDHLDVVRFLGDAQDVISIFSDER